MTIHSSHRGAFRPRLAWNDRGQTYVGAVVSDGVLPGVALLATGAWYTPRPVPRPARPARVRRRSLSSRGGYSRVRS